MEIEKRPYTLNTHYYSDYKDKFLSFYRGCREKGDDPQIVKNLQTYKPYVYVPGGLNAPSPFQNGMAEVLSALPKVGINGTRPADLARLFAPDPMEPALDIMAGVRAYFQGAYSATDRVRCMLISASQSRTRGSLILFLRPSTTS
jgi:hypothetical protein